MKTPLEKMMEKARKRTEERKANEENIKNKIKELQTTKAAQEGLLKTYAETGDFEKYADTQEKIRRANDMLELAKDMLKKTEIGTGTPEKNPEFIADMKRLKEAYAADVNPDWKEITDLCKSLETVTDRILEKTASANALRQELRESYGGERGGGAAFTTHYMTIRNIKGVAKQVHELPDNEKKGYML